jgi:hypothetical protein
LALTAQSFFLGAGDVLFGPQGAPVSLKDRVLDWSVSVTQNLDADLGYHPARGSSAGASGTGAAGGVVRCLPSRGRRGVAVCERHGARLQFVLDLATSSARAPKHKAIIKLRRCALRADGRAGRKPYRVPRRDQ